MFHSRPGSRLEQIEEDSERIERLLEQEVLLLQQILDRLPAPPTYQPTTGITITPS
jgi:hypothetical protein